ncbi:TolC family protein [Gemmata sp. JC673]|uniref:TolC family protein n=1 Tax=Gemmata algarum TaxID=2975278 RepID=A0ABU5EVM1_9BACT|nr:TolC family protein [Gemmata algarum]MDY3559216.1 TolC family protein [Gemmata algarum]
MSRSRWFKRALAGVLTISAAGGCKQQLFMEPGDYKDAAQLALPKSLEANPHGTVAPGQVDKLGGPVNTVTDFVRPPRMMKLSECIALAMEQGNVGSQSPNNPGFKNDALQQFSGRAVGGSDAIRSFAIDPAVAAAEIERSLSKFDARWITSMQWQKIDQPVAAQFLSFQQSRDAASFSSTLAKPLPTGGVAGITFSTDYSKFSQQATTQTQLVNPNYTPRVQLTVEQPLLRLFGVEVNQLSPTHPGSLLITGLQSTGQGTEGILITRIRMDQQRATFDQLVNTMLLNVEAAYWNLYASYYNLYAQEEGLRQAFEAYRYTKLRVVAGALKPQRQDQVQAQFERFRANVYQARGQVLESERQLRGLIGLRSDDGARLVPIDEPNLAPYQPDFHEAANDAIAYRPELLIARQDVKFRQLDLLLQKQLRRPDLRGFAQYDMAGLGTRLDGRAEDFGPTGASPGNAFGNFIDNRFNSWTLGVRLDMPIGFRDANALVRQAQLNMEKSYFQLRNEELRAIEFLTLQYRRVNELYTVIGPRRAERESLQKYVARVRAALEIGGPDPTEFLNDLTVQQQLAAAVAAETQAIANYNIALAQFEYAKGTIQQYNRVSVSEGVLPPWVSKRAADHIRERTEAALKLREQPVAPGGTAVGGHPVSQAGGTASLLQLPPFAEKRDPLPMDLPKTDDPAPARPPGSDTPPGGRAQPGAGPIGALPVSQPRPLPTFGAGSGADFQPNGRAPLPPLPAGSRPVGGGFSPPAGTGAASNPDEYFRSEGRALVPEPPPLYRSATGASAAPGTPGDQPRSDARVVLPPETKKASEPVWNPPALPTPPATGGATVPQPPTIPPTLP